MNALNASITIAAATLIVTAAHADKSPHTQRSEAGQPVTVESSRQANSPPVIGGPAQKKTAPVITGTGKK